MVPQAFRHFGLYSLSQAAFDPSLPVAWAEPVAVGDMATQKSAVIAMIALPKAGSARIAWTWIAYRRLARFHLLDRPHSNAPRARSSARRCLVSTGVLLPAARAQPLVFLPRADSRFYLGCARLLLPVRDECSAKQSARAAIVSAGFTATGPGITEPSATYSPG